MIWRDSFLQATKGQKVFKQLWSSWIRPWFGRVRWNQQETLLGLGAPVELRTESYGVHHLFAHNEEDMFRAQGFMTARDRLFQMDMMRRTAAGRLAELYGDVAGIGLDNTLHLRGQGLASIDYMMRVLGLQEAALNGLSWISPKTYRALVVYAEGVNEWMATARKTGQLSIGYQALAAEPEEWKPTDSLLILRLIGFQLSFSWRLLLAFGALSHKLAQSPERLQALLPPHLSLSLSHLETYNQWIAAQKPNPSVQRETEGKPSDSTIFPPGTGQGSCAWVVSGAQTYSGLPMLCNDPHLSLRLPCPFYQTRLTAGSYNVVGISIPGHPGIYLGHNDQIAWGASLSRVDDADIFLEELDPSGQRYRYQSRWLPLIKREEVIRVRGEEDKQRWVRCTAKGPLLSDALRGPMPAHLSYSLAWTGHEGVRESEALLQFNRAQNWEQFRQALRHARVPSLGFVYADRKNNIGAMIAGRCPQRNHSPRLFHPLPSADGAFDWQGDIPFEQLPFQYNPKDGMLILSGQDPSTQMFESPLQGLWEPNHRANRIKALLERNLRTPATSEQMARLQRDQYCTWSREFIQRVLQPYQKNAKLTPPVEEALESLIQWNGRYGPASLAAPFFTMFQVKLFEQTYLPNLGDSLYRRWIDIADELGHPAEALFRRDDCWLDRPREDILHYALTQAFHTLQNKIDNDPNKWSWKHMHRLTLRPLFFWGGNYQSTLTRGPFGTGGTHNSLNTGNHSWSRPFEHRVGSASRQIIDLGNWDRSNWVLCGGQCEDPRSPHYDDQLELWERGDHLPMPFHAHQLHEQSQWLLPRANSSIPSYSLALSAPNAAQKGSPPTNGNP